MPTGLRRRERKAGMDRMSGGEWRPRGGAGVLGSDSPGSKAHKSPCRKVSGAPCFGDRRASHFVAELSACRQLRRVQPVWSVRPEPGDCRRDACHGAQSCGSGAGSRRGAVCGLPRRRSHRRQSRFACAGLSNPESALSGRQSAGSLRRGDFNRSSQDAADRSGGRAGAGSDRLPRKHPDAARRPLIHARRPAISC